MDRQDIPGEVRLGGTGRWTVPAALIGVVGLGAAGFLATRGEHGTEAFFRSYLHNFSYFLTLALGGLFFVLITHLTRAGWAVALRRFGEVLASALLPLALLSIVILFGIHEIYEWSHEEAVAHDGLLQHKAPYLNTSFFIARVIAYFVLWNLLAWIFMRNSTTQDRTGDPKITTKLESIAAPGTIVFALTVTFASFDLLMSLYPHWYSTIFGVYFFAGCVVSFCSLIPILVTLFQGAGHLQKEVSMGHFHDVGKLMFAFVVFWAYIAFSQYMLIWYGNIPEETSWYLTRQSGPWLGLSVVLLAGHFFVPFFWLMSRHPKRRKLTLVPAALWLLAMHWIDLLYLTAPEARPDGPIVGAMDIACFLGLGGVFFAYVFWRFGTVNLIPVRDPRLNESLGLEHV